MKSVILTGLSFVLTGAVIGNAYYQKKQFYPSVVYITKSNPSMAVGGRCSTDLCSADVLHNVDMLFVNLIL